MTLIEAVTATYATVGQRISDIAIQMVVSDLSGYPLNDVLLALSKVRKRGKHIALADILALLPGQHPGVEEAWCTVSQCLNHEDVSIVWTDQMAGAYGDIRHLTDDPIAARMAFKEIYGRLIGEANDRGDPPQWRPSLGHDPVGREAALLEAVQKKRLSADFVLRLVVQGGDAEALLLQLIGRDPVKRLE